MLYSSSMGKGWIRFDRNELAGAFGDIGTDLPLIIAMILVAGLPAASAPIIFCVKQGFSGVRCWVSLPPPPPQTRAALGIGPKLSSRGRFWRGLGTRLC